MLAFVPNSIRNDNKEQKKIFYIASKIIWNKGIWNKENWYKKIYEIKMLKKVS